VTAAHPGWTDTDLNRTSGVMAKFFNPLVAMKPHDGALPTLRSATDPTATGGGYWGPARMFEMNGPPVAARVSKRAKDTAACLTAWSGIAADHLRATSGHGPYAGQATAIAKVLAATDSNPRLSSPPEIIADTIARALRARRPRTRYAVGAGAGAPDVGAQLRTAWRRPTLPSSRTGPCTTAPAA